MIGARVHFSAFLAGFRSGRKRNSTAGNGAVTVLVAHPSPDLYGSDRVLLESVKGLVAGGTSVTVTVPGTGLLIEAIEATGAAVAICPTPVLRRSILTPKGFWHFCGQTATGLTAGARLLRRIRPDAIYVNTVTVPMWLVLARLFRNPAIVHVHEAESSHPKIVRLLLTAPLLLATSIIANSNFTAALLTDSFSKLTARIVVVYNGVPGPPHPEAPRPVVTPTLRLLYVGRISPRKGVDVAIRALGDVSRRGLKASLDVVGSATPGSEWYESELHELVESLGLGDAVVFHGFTSQIWPHLARADVVLVPSRMEESFGNTAVEALLAGRPVIVSDSSGLREAAANYLGAQLVPPDDAAAVADAVARVVENWTEYRRRAQIDAAAARSRHSPEAYGAQIRAALSSVLM